MQKIKNLLNKKNTDNNMSENSKEETKESKKSLKKVKWDDNKEFQKMFKKHFSKELDSTTFSSSTTTTTTEQKKQEEDNDDSIKFWRRTDLLIPGQSITIPKEEKLVHLLSKPISKEEEKKRELEKEKKIEKKRKEREERKKQGIYDDPPKPPIETEIIQNVDRCFTISHLLSEDECDGLVDFLNKFEFKSLTDEYPKEYRNSERLLVISKTFSNLIWKRLKGYLKKEDLQNVRPYGFDNNGKWKAIGINECLRFSKYNEKSFFKAHMDGQFIRNDNEKSIYSVLIYLNERYYGGRTTLLKKVKEERLVNNNNNNGDLVMSFKKLGKIDPKKGCAAVFNQDLYHEGGKVRYGYKYILRTDIMFKRVDSESVPRGIVNYKDEPLFRKVKELVDKSNELEKNGQVKEATENYLKAQEIQVELSHSMYNVVKRFNGKLSYLEQILPEEVFVIIFSYLTSEEVVKSILLLNYNLNQIGRNENLWMIFYERSWPSNKDNQIIYKLESKLLNNVGNNNEDLEEDVEEYKDWYQTFICRKYLEKDFCAVLLDPGASKYSFTLQTNEKCKESHSVCATPNHPHFYYPGYGYDDMLVGDRVAIYHTAERPLFTRDGTIESFDNFKVLIYQLYKDDVRVPLRKHPLLIATHPRWINEDLEEIKEKVFELGIPAVCFVDTSKLISLKYQLPTSLHIQASSSGIYVTPIINGEPKIENRKCVDISVAYITEFAQMKDYYSISFNYRIAKKFLCFSPFDREKQPFEYEQYKKQVNEVNVGSSYYPKLMSSTVRLGYGELYFGEGKVMKIVKEALEGLESDDIRKECLNHIIVTGGLAVLDGFKQRLENELTNTFGKELDLNTIVYQEKRPEKPTKDDYYSNRDKKVEYEGCDMDVLEGAKIFSSLSNVKQYYLFNNNEKELNIDTTYHRRSRTTNK
ncbi:hypothetical protein ABK040_003979 [Willaertia magna]